MSKGWPTGINNESSSSRFRDPGLLLGRHHVLRQQLLRLPHIAWYDQGGGGDDHVIWANVPDAKALTRPAPAAISIANGNSYADVEMSILSHEASGAIASP